MFGYCHRSLGSGPSQSPAKSRIDLVGQRAIRTESRLSQNQVLPRYPPVEAISHQEADSGVLVATWIALVTSMPLGKHQDRSARHLDHSLNSESVIPIAGGPLITHWPRERSGLVDGRPRWVAIRQVHR